MTGNAGATLKKSQKVENALPEIAAPQHIVI